MSEQSVFDSKTTLLDSIIQPIPDPHYTIDSPFIDLERMLEGYHNNWGLNLEPDFQRGHVWTDAQRISYMEGILRGTVGESQRVIQFNAPHWDCPWSDWEGLTTEQVTALGQIATFKNLAGRLAEDLEYLAESTELDDADRNHIEEMQRLIAETLAGGKVKDQ